MPLFIGDTTITLIIENPITALQDLTLEGLCVSSSVPYFTTISAAFPTCSSAFTSTMLISSRRFLRPVSFCSWIKWHNTNQNVFRPLKCLSGPVTSKETAVPKLQCFEGRGDNPRNESFDIFLQISNFLGLVTANLLDFWESCDTHRETRGLILKNPQKLLGSEKSFVKLRHAYSVKAGSHIIAAIVSIAAVNSKSGLTIGTIIWEHYINDR